MTGRGIDQILPHPGDSTLREPVADARRYVTYAETASGPSAAVSIVVAIDKLLGRKQYVHVVATGLMCIPPSAPRVEICDHLTPVILERFHLVSPRRRNCACLRKTSMLSEKSRWVARVL